MRVRVPPPAPGTPLGKRACGPSADLSFEIEGFLPPRVAAEVMGLSAGELLSLVHRGLLEAEDVGERELWVRPAVVSVLAVNDVW